MTGKDLRSELAIKRDEWLASDEGKMCADIHSLRRNRHYANSAIYLRNRIETAFLAGAKANEEVRQEVCDKIAAKHLDS